MYNIPKAIDSIANTIANIIVHLFCFPSFQFFLLYLVFLTFFLFSILNALDFFSVVKFFSVGFDFGFYCRPHSRLDFSERENAAFSQSGCGLNTDFIVDAFSDSVIVAWEHGGTGDIRSI